MIHPHHDFERLTGRIKKWMHILTSFIQSETRHMVILSQNASEYNLDQVDLMTSIKEITSPLLVMEEAVNE